MENDIKSLGLSVRTTNALLNDGVVEVSQLKAMRDAEILLLIGISRKGLKEIREKIPHPMRSVAACKNPPQSTDLRDWFAGQALTGFEPRHCLSSGEADAIALSAYMIADAMIAARKGGAA